MIISHKYKLIFIHIPKAAGTFMTKLLENLDKNSINCDNHTSAKNAKKKFPELWDSYTKICIIRNSWDREMSFMFYMKSYRSHHEHHIVENMNVTEYLEWRKTRVDHQVDYILDDNGVCLVDYILSFEDLNTNIKNFFRGAYNIDVSPHLPPKKREVSIREPNYRRYYNDHNRRMLHEMHLPDIKHFEFVFGWDILNNRLERPPQEYPDNETRLLKIP